jgi:uncharacterized protein
MKENPMTTDIQKLDPDAAIDLAYDIFLEMAGENLDPADIMLFNLQFEDRGAVDRQKQRQKKEKSLKD